MRARRVLAGAVVSIGLAGTILGAAGPAAGVDPTSSTTVPGSSTTSSTIAPEGDAATFAFVSGPELSCDPAITEATDTYRVTKAPWATDLVVVPQVQANGENLVFTPADLGPGVTTATASVTYPTPDGHSSRGATGSLIVLNSDRTPASTGDIPVAFVGAIYCPPTTTLVPTTSPPGETVAPAAVPVATTANFTG